MKTFKFNLTNQEEKQIFLTDKYMYIAVNKTNPQEYHNFTWTENDKLVINGQEVNPNDWEVVEVMVI